MQLDIAYTLLSFTPTSLRVSHWPRTNRVPGFYTTSCVFLAIYQLALDFI